MAMHSSLQFPGSSSLLCLAAGLLALLYFLTSLKKSVSRLPPGPRPLPLIGNLNVVDLKKPFHSLTEVGGKCAIPEKRNATREMEMGLCLHGVEGRS